MIWELVQIALQLLYALILVVVVILLFWKYRKNKIQRETPNLLYIFFRYQAKKILCRKGGKNKNQLEDLQNSISDLICKDLDLSFLSTQEDKAEIQEKEKEITKNLLEIWVALQKKIPENMEDRKDDLLKALIFELDSGLIQRPSDLLGRRRSHRLKTLFMQKLNNSELKELKGTQKSCVEEPLKKIKTILRRIPGIEFYLNTKMFSFIIFVKTVALALVVHCYDYVTDGFVISEYYDIAYAGRVKSIWTYSKIIGFDGLAGLPTVERFTDLVNATASELEDLSLRNTFSMVGFLSFLLLCIASVSLVLLIPSLPSLHSLYSITRTMLCSDTERKNTVDPAKVLNRFNFSRSESGTESNMQLIFQMSTYLVMTWQLTWMATKVFPGSEDFFRISSLWKSFAMSIFSISMGQFKTRMVLHEFSTDVSKKIAYLIACILNTIFASLIWIPLVMAVLDCTNFGGLELSAGGGILLPSGRWRSKMLALGFFLSLLLIIIIPAFSFVLRLPTSAVSPDITSLNSEEFSKCLMKRLVFIAILLGGSGILNLALVGFARETVSPVLIDFGSRFPNYIVPETSSGFSSGFLTPSTVTEGNARRNFILLSSILMPLCLVGSFLMLFYYFKDNTNFMRFKKTHKGKIERTLSMPWGSINLPRCVAFIMRPQSSFCCYSLHAEDGVWEDLTDLKDGKTDEEILNMNPFLSGQEQFDQELLDSVMQSFPSWKDKKPIKDLLPDQSSYTGNQATRLGGSEAFGLVASSRKTR